MNINQCRDWLAARNGWLSDSINPKFSSKDKKWISPLYDDEWKLLSPVWYRNACSFGYEEVKQFHPYNNNLTAAITAMPKGWGWTVGTYGRDGYMASAYTLLTREADPRFYVTTVGGNLATQGTSPEEAMWRLVVDCYKFQDGVISK